MKMWYCLNTKESHHKMWTGFIYSSAVLGPIIDIIIIIIEKMRTWYICCLAGLGSLLVSEQRREFTSLENKISSINSVDRAWSGLSYFVDVYLHSMISRSYVFNVLLKHNQESRWSNTLHSRRLFLFRHFELFVGKFLAPVVIYGMHS